MSASKAARSLLVVLFVTVIGIGFAYLAGQNSINVWGYQAVLVCAALAFAVNWIAFVPASIAQSDKYYDTTGALTYLSVIGVAACAAWPLGAAKAAIVGMVAIWTIRLGSFLFRRIHASGGTDVRFEKIKINPPRFLVAWTLQAVWVILTASAAIIAITSSETLPTGTFFWVGALIWIVGFGFEAVADKQKSDFKADPANKGRFIDTGLWAWSQHPNYFGEITLWFGILVMAIPVLSGWSWLAIISPLFVYLLLTRISGINLLDKSAKERWGDDPAYQNYRAKTPVLIPRPPSG